MTEPTRDELTAAAERVRKFNSGTFDYWTFDTHPLECLNDDRRVLADAFLALQPASESVNANMLAALEEIADELCDNDGQGCPCVEVAEKAISAARAQAADDAMPVDEEWLRTIGFGVQGLIGASGDVSLLADISVQEHTGWFQFLRICIPTLEAQLMQCHGVESEAEGMALPEGSASTRGGVHRLLAALGVRP